MDPTQAPIATVRDPSLIASAASDRETLICFSPVRWNFVHQRPQHLMTRAARRYDVFFFEEPIVAKLAAPRLELTRVADAITVAVPNLPGGQSADARNRALHRLLHRLLLELPGTRRIFWYYTPLALAFSRGLTSDVMVYDNVDGLAANRHAPGTLPLLEHELFACCDLVFCAGQSLYEAKRHRHPSVHAFPGSIDRAHFELARSKPDDPADQASIERPRLGYFGVIDERIDLDLVDRLTSEAPDWQWIMLGPVAKIDPGTLPRRPNLHWLGLRSYRELPAYLAHWDIGVMPFALNEATRFISPTKTPEFLAAGVPVVSTPIHDIVRPYGERGLVQIASGWEQFLSEARTLLWRPRRRWLEDVDRFLAGTSWESTWQNMDALIRGVMKAGAPPVDQTRRCRSARFTVSGGIEGRPVAKSGGGHA